MTNRQPLPEPSELTQGFWDAAARHELVVQRCADCSLLRHYPRLLCPACRSNQWSWQAVSGRGTVHSFTVTHKAFNPAWEDRVPYAIATVELDEGLRMIGDLPPEDTADVRIGAAVQVFFDRMTEDITLPRFRLDR